MENQASPFNFPVFAQYLHQICLIGISAAHSNNEEFCDLRKRITEELEKYSTDAATVFKAILSDDFLKKVAYDAIRPFNDGLMNYAQTFIKIRQLHQQTILSNLRLGKSHFVEIIQQMKSTQEAKLLTCVPLYLDRIAQQYMLSTEKK
jgi:hypothetical protein